MYTDLKKDLSIRKELVCENNWGNFWPFWYCSPPSLEFMFKNNLSYSNSSLVSLKLEKFHENGFAPKSIVFIRMFYDLK